MRLLSLAPSDFAHLPNQFGFSHVRGWRPHRTIVFPHHPFFFLDALPKKLSITKIQRNEGYFLDLMLITLPLHVSPSCLLDIEDIAASDSSVQASRSR